MLRRSEERYGQAMYCDNLPLPGRNRCKFHGGASPRGAEHPCYTGRGYSKDLPTRLADRLKQSLEDPELTSLHSEIALIDARLGELLSGLPTGESGQAWDDVIQYTRALEGAVATGDMDKIRGLVEDLADAVDSGDKEQKAWNGIIKAVGERRKLADVERKREEQHAATLTARQAMTLVGALQAAILEEVHDEVTRGRIAQRLQWLLNLQEGDKTTPGNRLQMQKRIDNVQEAEWEPA